MAENYDENFYRGNGENSQKRASVVLPVVAKYILPKKVIDIGCGAGGWLYTWKKFFGAEVYGIDGDYAAREQLLIDESEFHPLNLENQIELNERFDLVECLEVAEHLSPARADSFVEDLTKLGDVILFSAAVIGQGGTHHVNEQMQSYWAGKFLKCGYVGIDCIRPQLWYNQNTDFLCKQNMFFYVKRSELYRYPEMQEYYLKNRENTIYDIIHPDLWMCLLSNFQNAAEKFQTQIKNNEERLKKIQSQLQKMEDVQ